MAITTNLQLKTAAMLPDNGAENALPIGTRGII
jgi:hypothetical protein